MLSCRGGQSQPQGIEAHWINKMEGTRGLPDALSTCSSTYGPGCAAEVAKAVLMVLAVAQGWQGPATRHRGLLQP